MAKCRHCGKGGLFFRVNSDGLCKDCVRLAELEKEEKEKKARLEELTSQLTDKEELFHELKTRAEEEALKDVENKLEDNRATIEQQEQEIEQQKNNLEATREEAQKNEKLIAGAANKVAKLRTLFKSIQYEIRKFEGDDENGNLSPNVGLESDMDLLLQPTVELNLNCLNVRDLRKRYKQNEKTIEELLNSYEGRYTTKANATIYRLMVIALRAELQNILYNIKYGNLEKATDNVKTITEKYLQIATDGNQSIAPTMKRFIGQLEYMFIEAVKIEYEYYVQKERIKEEQKTIRDQMRQEAEERKLLEKERKKVEKEAAIATAGKERKMGTKEMVMKMVHIDIAVRKKIVRAREKGLCVAEICEAYDVGKSAVYALLKQARETGDITPKLHLRGRKPSYSEEDVASIKSLIDAQCDITAGEIKERLELELCESSIRTIIREKLGYRHKKRRYMPVNESAPT